MLLRRPYPFPAHPHSVVATHRPLRRTGDNKRTWAMTIIGHDPRCARRNPGLSGPAAARHRRVPAHDRAALRRPREVDPRARRGDERRQADPARDAEERRRRRSGDRRILRGRHARDRAAAAEAARRHRQGAGRGHRARARVTGYRRPQRLSTRPRPSALADEHRRATSRSRRWRARSSPSSRAT